MRRVLPVVTVAAGVLLMAGSAFAPSVFALEAGVRGMYWGSTISGNVQTVTSGVPGTDLDVKSDLCMKLESRSRSERRGRTFPGKFSLNCSLGKVE